MTSSSNDKKSHTKSSGIKAMPSSSKDTSSTKTSSTSVSRPRPTTAAAVSMSSRKHPKAPPPEPLTSTTQHRNSGTLSLSLCSSNDPSGFVSSSAIGSAPEKSVEKKKSKVRHEEDHHHVTRANHQGMTGPMSVRIRGVVKEKGTRWGTVVVAPVSGDGERRHFPATTALLAQTAVPGLQVGDQLFLHVSDARPGQGKSMPRVGTVLNFVPMSGRKDGQLRCSDWQYDTGN